MKKIIITGGAGFIGSNFIEFIINKYQDYKIINIDNMTYAGKMENMKSFYNNPRHKFIEADISDNKTLENIFNENDISGVIHFAAESHVDNSIENPDLFIKTNINGTFNLLHNCYKKWMNKPFEYKNNSEKLIFLHISTDEVYGSLGSEGLFSEKSPYAPNSPYSASKAASDMIVRSYFETYGLNTIITNCSNNFGPNQDSEKLIPKIILNALRGENIPIYGDGLNVRDWLYVTDHCSAIDRVYHKGKYGETYNIGGNTEKTNLEIVNHICSVLDEKKPKNESYKELITFVEDRPGHDKRYAVDSSKIENDLSWTRKENFDSAIIKTIDWYLEKEDE